MACGPPDILGNETEQITFHLCFPNTLSGVPSVNTINSLKHRMFLCGVCTSLISAILILNGLLHHMKYKLILLDVIGFPTVAVMDLIFLGIQVRV